MSYANLLGINGKIQSQYLPASSATTPTLEQVLQQGNLTNGQTIVANTFEGNGTITTDILALSEIRPTGFPVIQDIGIKANVVVADTAELAFVGPAVITSRATPPSYKLSSLPTQNTTNVLTYDTTTETIGHTVLSGGTGNLVQDNTNQGSVAISTTNVSPGTILLGTNMSPNQNAGQDNIILGRNAMTMGTLLSTEPQNTIAIGINALTGTGGGADASINATNSVVVGANAAGNITDNASGCVVIGNGACLAGIPNNTIAIGEFANAGSSTSGSVIIGQEASRGRGGPGNIAIGQYAYDAQGIVGIGGSQNVVIGTSAGIALDGDRNIIIGNDVGSGNYTSPWSLFNTCVIGKQLNDTQSNGADALFMQMDANQKTAALWSRSPSKVRTQPLIPGTSSSIPGSLDLNGDILMRGIFQGGVKNVVSGPFIPGVNIQNGGFTQTAVLNIVYPYNSTVSPISGSWILKVSLVASARGIAADLGCYMEITNTTTPSTTVGLLFSANTPCAAPFVNIGGQNINTIQIQDGFVLTNFTQGDSLSIRLFVRSSTGTTNSFVIGSVAVVEYELTWSPT